MLQQILSNKQQLELLQAEDLRALTPLFWNHINPYGTFRLDMSERLIIETTEEQSATDLEQGY